MTQLDALSKDQVLSVYVGKNGRCCCGCSGKHTYNSANLEAAGKKRGYAIKGVECNDREVTRVLNLIKANAQNVLYADTWVSIVLGKKVLIAYLMA